MALTPLTEALQQILATATATPDVETVPTGEARHRFCAQLISAPMAVPPRDNSAMDGYAVRVGDIPAVLPVSQRIPAGAVPEPLSPGTAARIFTGAPVPTGADAIVLQEDVTETPEGIFFPSATLGQHIRRRGDDIAPGDQLVARGQCLQPQDLGLLASVGLAQVEVYRPLRVAILTTGDELREPGAGQLAPGEIYNSNRVMLSAQIRALGMSVSDLGNLPDDPGRIGDALEEAAGAADCIVTAGGVSVGEEDHIRAQVEARGSLSLWKLAIKPGKPLAFGEVRGTPIFGLPGNPVSAWITFVLVAKPWLIKQQGGIVAPVSRYRVRAGFSVTKPGTREEFLRVRFVGEGDARRAELTGNQSSGVLTSLSRAEALAVLPAGESISEGDWLEIIPLSVLGDLGAC